MKLSMCGGHARLLMALGLFGLAGTGRLEAQLVIESTSGTITPNEINAFKSYIQSVNPRPNGWTPTHNEYSFGTTGRLVDAMGMMYEATGDIAILDRMIAYSDTILAARNDLMPASLGGRRVMWTGVVEKVWPPEAPTHDRAQYAGSETADVMERLAFTALLILRNHAIWDRTVPDGNPNGFGATYRQRALTYISRCDESSDQYFVRWFVTSANLLRWPTDAKWTAPMRGGDTPGAPVPWNQQAMFTGAFLRLAECHEILGDDPGRVSKYDAIVRASMNEFRSDLVPHTNSNGSTVYKWNYSLPSNSIENVGHAAYDMIGLHRAYSRRGAYGMTAASLRPFADTLSTIIYKGNNRFAGSIDGTGTLQDSMLGEWLPVGDWNQSAYGLMANADVASGRYKTSGHMTAAILWMKYRRANGGARMALPPLAATASGFTGTHAPASSVDGDLGTRWARSGDGAWIRYDLGSARTVNLVKLAWYNGTSRTYRFDVQLSTDGSAWTTVIANRTSSGTSNALQTYDFTDASARYVRVVGHGSSADGYINVTEAQAWGK